MRGKVWAVVSFVVGIFCMFVYTTAFFLWLLIGVPLSYSPLPTMIWGFLPPIGAVLMVIAGLVYGRGTKEGVK